MAGVSSPSLTELCKGVALTFSFHMCLIRQRRSAKAALNSFCFLVCRRVAPSGVKMGKAGVPLSLRHM